jgi:hypothetical protein
MKMVVHAVCDAKCLELCNGADFTSVAIRFGKEHGRTLRGRRSRINPASRNALFTKSVRISKSKHANATTIDVPLTVLRRCPSSVFSEGPNQSTCAFSASPQWGFMMFISIRGIQRQCPFKISMTRGLNVDNKARAFAKVLFEEASGSSRAITPSVM